MITTYFKLICLSAVLVSSSITPWSTDFDKAKAQAKEEGKNILIYFSGSDWCKPCIKLKKEIIETSEFQNFAQGKFVMVLADFPRKKENRLSKEQQKHNDALAEKYNLDGYFPLMVITDENGNVLGRSGYDHITVDQYIDRLKEMIEI